jgi:hypothetical protein
MASRTALLRLSADNHRPAVRLADLLRTLSHKIDETLIHRYHPERHYMRGPGPRWYAKHGPARATGRDG